MIVVVGSRHDPVASALCERWPSAGLCSAEDLGAPGWSWSYPETGHRTWQVGGRAVADAEVTGVFVRRSAVYPEELSHFHPEDRAFQAAELHAFLTFVLATSAARVVNPVFDGAFGEEAIGGERITAAARACGLEVAPFRVSPEGFVSQAREIVEVEVVADQAFGDLGPMDRKALAIAADTGIEWGVFRFDSDGRFVAATAGRPPGDAAADALGRRLATPREASHSPVVAPTPPETLSSRAGRSRS